jgi:hypothetical protein
MVSPIAFAAFRLTTSRNLVGYCTGNSPISVFRSLTQALRMSCRLARVDLGLAPIASNPSSPKNVKKT